MDYFCIHCKDTGIDPTRSVKTPTSPTCKCGGFTREDFQNFYVEIAEEMVLLGKSSDEAKTLVEERFISRGPSWMLFHDPPGHWAKLVVLGPGYWRKKDAKCE